MDSNIVSEKIFADGNDIVTVYSINGTQYSGNMTHVLNPI